MRRIASFLLLASITWGAHVIYIGGNVITVDPSKPNAQTLI